MMFTYFMFKYLIKINDGIIIAILLVQLYDINKEKKGKCSDE